jgi:Bifunctional DNA primase/polymerase, N-terminal
MSPDPTRALLARSLALFPIPAGAKQAPVGWHELVTTDPAAVRAWPAGGNVGVACRASGIVGLDLDRKDDVDGTDTLRALCAAARRPWPATLTVTTPHGGLHLYFRAPTDPGDVVVPSSIGRWPGIDVRAPGRRLGGYLVGPGSTVDGRRYVITQDLPIAPLPGWITTHLTIGRRRAALSAPAAG